MRAKSAVRRAMNAHTDLNLFHAVINLTETHFRGDQKTAAAALKIAAICRKQAARLLRIMDAAEEECDRAPTPKDPTHV